MHHNEQNNHSGHDMRMMWIMMLACALPLLIVSFGGTGTNRTILIIVAFGLMFGLHALLMRRKKKPADSQSGEHKDDHSSQNDPPSCH